MPEPQPTSRSKRLGRLFVRLLASCVVIVLLVEGFFRYALFGDDPLSNRIARELPTLRQPQSYAYSRSAEYWKLQYWVLGRGRWREARYAPLLGWLNESVEPVTYAHAGETARVDRTTVLLFGDSFAECVTPADECWQGLLASSNLSTSHHILNYGTRGYGLGQTSLLCRRAVERHASERPIVVVSLLVDDDLDRSVLDFRMWPKPVFRLDGNGMLLLEERLLPRTRDAYIESVGIGITSYTWRYLRFGTKLMPNVKKEAAAEHLHRVLTLSGAILDQLVADLEASGLDYGFFLFHGRSFMRAKPPYMQREEFVVRKLEELGVPYAISRTALTEDALETGRTEADYYYSDGPGKDHYTPLGTELVFRTLRVGIESRFREW